MVQKPEHDREYRETAWKANWRSVWFAVAVLCVAVTMSAWLVHRDRYQRVRREAFGLLESVVRLKVDALLRWRASMLETVSVLQFAAETAVGPSGREAAIPLKVARDRIVHLRMYPLPGSFTRVVLADSSGNVLATDPPARSLAPELLGVIRQAAASRSVSLSDVYRVSDGKTAVACAASAGNGQPGVVTALETDLRGTLYALLSWWPTDSRSAETLLVRREGDHIVFLNPLRYDSRAALRRTIPLSRKNVPTVQAVLGARGPLEGVDYRGVPVLAYALPVPGSDWFIVARMDRTEAMSPATEMDRMLALLVAVALAALVSGVALAQRHASSVFLRSELEHERARAALVERYSALLEAIPDIIMETDSNRVYTWANQGGKDFFGDDVVGKPASYYFAGEQNTLETVAPLFKGEAPDTVYVESWQRRKDGTPRLLAWWCRALHDERGNVIGALSSAHDITEQRRAAEREAAIERRYRRLLDLLPDAYWIVGHATQVLYANDAAARFCNLPRDAMAARSLADCMPAAVASHVCSAVEECARTQEPRRLLLDFVPADANRQWWAVTIQPIPDGAALIAENVTEREERRVELEQKTAEMERFLYVVSHDLRSPVVTISAFAAHLARDLEGGNAERVAQDLGYLQSAARTMHRLLDALLALSRAGRVPLEPVETTFRAVADEAVSAVAEAIRRRGVQITFEGPDVRLLWDRRQLVQILQNLIENAVKYMGDQPTPVVTVGASERDGETVFFVRDNGVGLDPEYFDKVFEVFQRMEKSTEGEGIGLTMVQRIVERCGGRVWIESAGRGHGLTVLFTLPRAMARGGNDAAT